MLMFLLFEIQLYKEKADLFDCLHVCSKATGVYYHVLSSVTYNEDKGRAEENIGICLTKKI